MKIKRYTASTMREAMTLVRRMHGDDAVILSSKEVQGGLEVMVALDPEIEEYRQTSDSVGGANSQNGQFSGNYEQAVAPSSRNIQAYQSTHSLGPGQGLAPQAAQAPQYAASNPAARAYSNAPVNPIVAGGSAPEAYAPSQAASSSKDFLPQSDAPNLTAMFQQKEDMHRMASELKAMRDLLENQMAGLAWGQLEHNAPGQIELIKRLVGLGIGWELSQKLVSQVEHQESSAWSKILQRMEQEISIENKDILESGGIYALVGPTGVGKTTTIAKIASRFVMRNHPNDLALISTDSYKVGAQAQLKIFADLLNVPVHVATTQDELYALISSFANKKLVLIDTAGMSQKAIQLSQQLTSGHHGGVPIKNYLVMSATTSLNVMQQVVEAFHQVKLSGCILTKVDEAASLGNILTILIEQTLPITYVSNGQRVPEDIEMIRPRDLIDQAIVLGQQNSKVMDEQAFRMGIAKEISNAQ